MHRLSNGARRTPRTAMAAALTLVCLGGLPPGPHVSRRPTDNRASHVDTRAVVPPPRSAAGSSGTPTQQPSPWTTTVSAGCSTSDLELVLPFYEGLRFKPAARALRTSKSERLELAYPGTLSMPLVAWRCAEGQWTAAITTAPLETPVALRLTTTGEAVNARVECFGPCAFQEVRAPGEWRNLATAVADRWRVTSPGPPLSSQVDRFHYFVRRWVANDAPPPLRTDWTAEALVNRLRSEDARTMAFAYGLDPNEVDLEGRYFWSGGALNEAKSLARANAKVAQFHWLNLRTFKYAIPSLAIEHPPAAEVRAAAKLYSDGVNDFPQYVFRSMEMCVGAEAWQRSRLDEMRKLIELGFKVIALDEFPTSPKWGPEPCRATNHLHRPNDFGDEVRTSLDFIRRLSTYARERGVLLTSEEPSAMLLPFISGYMDGMFNDPPEMYEHWRESADVERIPLFSAMFGDLVTPYTRPGGSAAPPKGWLIQEKQQMGR
jgi:hypothetical protein